MSDAACKDSALRQMRRAHRDWPSFITDRPAPAEKAFLALSEVERDEAIAHIPAYLDAIKRKGLKPGAFSNYLSQKRWERLDAEDLRADAKPVLHKRYTKAWQGAVLALLLGPESPLPSMPATLARLVAGGGPLAERERRAHRERYAWPKVTAMYADSSGAMVIDSVIAASEDFRSFSVTSAEGEAWKRLYAAYGWPWPDMGSHPWLCFPPSDGISDADIDAALDRFKRKLAGDRGDEHAA